MAEYKLSLCIPTNGITEWVVPVLKSIYDQKVDNSLFEVVVCDNGQNENFEKDISEFYKYDNFVYKKSEAQMFQNQIACFKLARGNLIKFINHRMVMDSGSIDYLLEFEKEYGMEKPSVYFSNGVLNLGDSEVFDSFDLFVRNLSYFSSWSAGLCVWKSDFETVPENQIYDQMFPHTTLLFYWKDKKKYVIKNRKILTEIDLDSTKKGRYNLFKTFAVNYPDILKDLHSGKFISQKTYDYVIKNLEVFLQKLYAEFVLAKTPCSYDLSDSNIYISTLINKEHQKYFYLKSRIFALKFFIRKIIK